MTHQPHLFMALFTFSVIINPESRESSIGDPQMIKKKKKPLAVYGDTSLVEGELTKLDFLT